MTTSVLLGTSVL